MSKKSSGYTGDIYQMPEKKGGMRVLIIVLFVILALILIGMLAFFGFLKSKENSNNNKDKAEINEEEKESFSTLVSNYVSNTPDYTFYFELSGKDIEKVFPSWLNYLLCYNYDIDTTLLRDGEDTIYVYGKIYGGGCSINVAAVNPDGYIFEPDGSKRDKTAALNEGTLRIVGNKDGLYLIDLDRKQELVYGVFKDNYYYQNMLGKVVRVADNGQGRDINQELLGFLESLKEADEIKLGVTPGGEFAFSCNKDYTYIIDNELEESITIPSGFSMYCTKAPSSGLIEFEGSSENLNIKGNITRTEEYVKPYKPASDIVIMEYKDFKAFMDEGRVLLEEY